MEALCSAIVSEIFLRKVYTGNEIIESIYFGGGTPSLLPDLLLARMMNALNSQFSIASNAEITLEANPDDINPQKIRSWKSMGINRLSIGLQSFNDAELKWMNRAHNARQSSDSVKMAQDAGLDNLTIDLIYGSKFQTESSWINTLEKAVDLKTKHVSAYNLTIENKTVLGLLHQRGKEPAVNEELSSRQFMTMAQVFGEAGFIHYEVSNFGQPGFFAKHNSNYWLQKTYLGLGPSAHSFNGVSRQWNVKNNPVYIRAISEGTSFSEVEELSVNDRYNEYVLTRLRTVWGCDVNEIRQLFGDKAGDYFLENIKPFFHLVSENKGIYSLNAEGRLIADGIASDLFLV